MKKKRGLMTKELKKKLRKSRNDNEILEHLAAASNELDDEDLFLVTGGAQYEQSPAIEYLNDLRADTQMDIQAAMNMIIGNTDKDIGLQINNNNGNTEIHFQETLDNKGHRDEHDSNDSHDPFATHDTSYDSDDGFSENAGGDSSDHNQMDDADDGSSAHHQTDDKDDDHLDNNPVTVDAGENFSMKDIFGLTGGVSVFYQDDEGYFHMK
jgi:hypothetical protein